MNETDYNDRQHIAMKWVARCCFALTIVVIVFIFWQ
jgi:hypothetical protein